MDIFSLSDKDAFKEANVFFSVYKELDSLFKRYGFDKDKDRITFDHEVGSSVGLCTYFRISEKPELYNGNGSETINFYIGALLRKGCIEYQIESINIVLYRDTEMNGKTIPVPFISKKYSTRNGQLPTKDHVLNKIENLLKIKRIREKFSTDANQPYQTLNPKRKL